MQFWQADFFDDAVDGFSGDTNLAAASVYSIDLQSTSYVKLY